DPILGNADGVCETLVRRAVDRDELLSLREQRAAPLEDVSRAPLAAVARRAHHHSFTKHRDVFTELVRGIAGERTEGLHAFQGAGRGDLINVHGTGVRRDGADERPAAREPDIREVVTRRRRELLNELPIAEAAAIEERRVALRCLKQRELVEQRHAVGEMRLPARRIDARAADPFAARILEEHGYTAGACNAPSKAARRMTRVMFNDVSLRSSRNRSVEIEDRGRSDARLEDATPLDRCPDE